MNENTTKTDKIIALAQSRGSTATTHAGAWRYLIKNLPGIIPGLYEMQKNSRYAIRNPGAPPTKPSQYWAEEWMAKRMERTIDGRARTLEYPAKSDAWADYCQAYEDNRTFDIRRATYLTRSAYGEIICKSPSYPPFTPAADPAPDAYYTALNLLKSAQKSLYAYDGIDFERKSSGKWTGGFEGGSVNVELYDFSSDGNAIVVCRRETEGSHWGVKTLSKKYYLITRTDDGEIAATETKQPVAKLAKADHPYGTIVTACLTGQRPKLTNKAILEAQQIHAGYKLLAQRNGDPDHLCSVWDGSHWDIGTQRTEQVREDHGGGLYYYRDLSHCLSAIEGNGVFGDAHEHHKLMIVEIEATGRHITYGHKYAAQKLTPVRVIGCTI